MEFLVRVDSPGDVPAFEDAMRNGDGVSHSQPEEAWVTEATADEAQPHDATYLVVEADDQDAIDEAIRRVRGYTKNPRLWVNGRPHYVVLDEREPSTYEA